MSAKLKATALAALLMLTACDKDQPKVAVQGRIVCPPDKIVEVAQGCGQGKYPEDCLRLIGAYFCPEVTMFRWGLEYTGGAWTPCNRATQATEKAACALYGAAQ